MILVDVKIEQHFPGWVWEEIVAVREGAPPHFVRTLPGFRRDKPRRRRAYRPWNRSKSFKTFQRIFENQQLRPRAGNFSSEIGHASLSRLRR
jgi:hypothetical protein